MDCKNVSAVKFLPWLRPYGIKPPKLLFRMFLAVLKSSKKFHKKDWKLLYDQWRELRMKTQTYFVYNGSKLPWSICWFPAPNSSPAGKQLRKWERMFRKMRRQDAPARRSGGADRYSSLTLGEARGSQLWVREGRSGYLVTGSMRRIHLECGGKSPSGEAGGGDERRFRVSGPLQLRVTRMIFWISKQIRAK